MSPISTRVPYLGLAFSILAFLSLLFSIPPSNALSIPSLAKRAATIVTFDKAKSRGSDSIALLKCDNPESTWNDYAQLAQNGWNEDNTQGETVIPPSDLSDALKGNKLSTSKDQWTKSNMIQDGEFPASGGRGVGEPTYAYYEEHYNPTQGAIIAAQNFGPASQVDKGEATPALKNWSDVVWLVWASICKDAGKDVNTIEYFFRWHVNNDSGTQDIINTAIGGKDNLKAWPGTQLKTSDTNGQALLGSAHGYGIVYFLKDHQKELGKKTVDYVTAYKTGNGEYSLLYHVTDV